MPSYNGRTTFFLFLGFSAAEVVLFVLASGMETADAVIFPIIVLMVLIAVLGMKLFIDLSQIKGVRTL